MASTANTADTSGNPAAPNADKNSQVAPMEQDAAGAANANANASSNAAASGTTPAPSTGVTRLHLGGAVVSQLDDDGAKKTKFHKCTLSAEYDPEGMLVRVCNASGETLQEFLAKKTTESARVGRSGIVFHLGVETILVRLDQEDKARQFAQMLGEIRTGAKASVFQARTEDSSATQYFQFYGYLSQQQNMMQDYIRTSTYQRAILANMTDFRDKVVLDVGAGSGILSFFAQQAGARKVFAVEGSRYRKKVIMIVLKRISTYHWHFFLALPNTPRPWSAPIAWAPSSRSSPARSRRLSCLKRLMSSSRSPWATCCSTRGCWRRTFTPRSGSSRAEGCSPRGETCTWRPSRTRRSTWSRSTRSTSGTRTTSTGSTSARSGTPRSGSTSGSQS